MELFGVLSSVAVALFVILLVPLIKSLHEYWWNPILVRRMMATQGIRGPPYRFIYGSTKELFEMQMAVMGKPLERLSHDIFPKVQPHIHAWIKQYGKNYLNWCGPQPQLVVTEPELIKELLIYREKTYQKIERTGLAHKLLGNGLLTVVDGEKWAKQRKLANHAFHGESLKGMVIEMVDGVKMMFKRWDTEHRDGKEMEVYEEFKLLTSEVIARTAFGSSYAEGSIIFQMLNKLAVITSKNFFSVKIPGIGDMWKTNDEIEGEKLAERIRNSILNIVKQREEKMASREMDGFGNDFLGELLKAYNDTDQSKKINVDTLVDECKTFYFAGQETTSGSLAWTVFLLATNRSWQEEVRKEILDVFGNDDPNSDGIPKLRMMTMVLNESLRLYPPVAGFTRKNISEGRLGRLCLPRDTQVFIPNLHVYHDPEIWGDDVHVFNPERFSEGVVKATNNNQAAFFPFGLGPRSCVGMNFAMMEMKIVLSMILQRYTFTLSPTYIHCPVQQLTTQPLRGIQVIFQSLT